MERVELTITGETIVGAASVLTALGAIGGAVLWCLRFVQRQRHQDREIAAIRREQTLICYGVLACLKGLKEQGCNGPVSEALSKLEKHLNQAAHEGESG